MNSIKLAIGLSMALLSGAAQAESAAGQGVGREDDQVYGVQLMTQQERLVYRNRMREAKTEAEREQIRAQHHEQMRERARKRGVVLPEAPAAHGMGGRGGDGAGKGNNR